MRHILKQIIDKLYHNQTLAKAEWITLIENRDSIDMESLFLLARRVRESVYKKSVYMRGLIEFTNYCKNDCFYCGIRCGNNKTERYRLTEAEILECCRLGYDLGTRTFVLQGGEDPYFTDDRLESIIRLIRSAYMDCAITLSVGERSRLSYERLYKAGVNRYLLRHETANDLHYSTLHPKYMSLENRKHCLKDLKEIGYQVGCGLMVGSPNQTVECLADDMLFIQELQPQMVGIGPFIPHCDTPFAAESGGSLDLTLFMVAVVRLLLPKVLLPATTALATIHPDGREMGLCSGANVIMPNLTPQKDRSKYLLYDGKANAHGEAADNLQDIRLRIERIGYNLVVDRGDFIGI